MSDGKWSGGAANRTWARPGSRHYAETLTAQQQHELYEQHADEDFWCETCGGSHPLKEHRQCRAQ